MDIFEMQAILSIYQRRNYNDAAYQLSISTSSLSKLISKAEEELGIQLFIRATKSRPVELTEAGQKLLPYIKKIITSWQELQRQASQLSNMESMEFNVGFVPSIGTFGDAKLFSSFIMENPNVHLHLWPNSPDKLLDMLHVGSVDCLMIPLSEWDLEPGSPIAKKLFTPGLVAQELRTVGELSIAVNRENPISKLSCLSREDHHLLNGKTVLLNSRSSYSYQLDRIKKELGLGDTSGIHVRMIDFDRPGTIYTMLLDNPDVVVPFVGTLNRRKREWVNIRSGLWSVKTHFYFVYPRSNKATPLKLFRRAVNEFQELVDGPGLNQVILNVKE